MGEKALRTSEDKLKVLKRARALIRNNRWIKSYYEPSHTTWEGKKLKAGFCAVGACNKALAELGYRVESIYEPGSGARLSLLKVLRSHGWKQSVQAWNDKDGRKKAEVIFLFDERIAELKAEIAAKSG